jgi:hypothetical protein
MSDGYARAESLSDLGNGLSVSHHFQYLSLKIGIVLAAGGFFLGFSIGQS